MESTVPLGFNYWLSLWAPSFLRGLAGPLSSVQKVEKNFLQLLPHSSREAGATRHGLSEFLPLCVLLSSRP